MTLHQRLLRIISIVLIVFGFVGFFTDILAGIAGAILAAFYSDAYNSALSDAGRTLNLAQEDYDAFISFMIVLPAVIFENLLQIITGFLGSRAAKHPAKIKPFFIVAGIFCGIEVVSSVAFSLGGYFDATSIALSVIPIMLVVLCLVCAHRVSIGFSGGSVKDIADIKGEQYKSELGFVRVIQILFLLNVCWSLVLCAMFTSSSFTFSFSEVLNFINLVFDGVGFWLIFQRSKAARYWIIAFSVFNIVAGIIYGIVSGRFDFFGQVVLCLWDIFLLLYFAFAKRPREVLNRSFDIKYSKQQIVQAWDIWQPKTWEFWRNMIIYFCLFSIVGHWMEAGLCLFVKYGIVPGIYDPNSGIWRDYLSPFPVYGAGMVACGLLLYPIKTKLQEKLGGTWKPLLISFIINSLVCASLELILGLSSNQPVDGVYPLWDYSTMPFNFMGQICLQNTLAFGVISTLMTWAVWPALQNISAKMPNDIRRAFFVAVVVFYAFVCCLYVVNIA